MPKKFGCFLSRAVFPAFVVLTTFSVVLCAAFMVSAAANADFCGAEDSTPDYTVLDMLVKADISQPDESLYKVAEYYAFQCTDKAGEDALLPLRTYKNDVVRTIQLSRKGSSRSFFAVEDLIFCISIR